MAFPTNLPKGFNYIVDPTLHNSSHWVEQRPLITLHGQVRSVTLNKLNIFDHQRTC